MTSREDAMGMLRVAGEQLATGLEVCGPEAVRGLPGVRVAGVLGVLLLEVPGGGLACVGRTGHGFGPDLPADLHASVLRTLLEAAQQQCWTVLHSRGYAESGSGVVN